MSKNNTTGYKGVYLMKNGKYRAGIGFNGKKLKRGNGNDRTQNRIN